MIGRQHIGEQFLKDLGLNTEWVEKVEIVFEPNEVTVAFVTRLMMLDKDCVETVKERYVLVRREVEDEQETKQSAPA